MLYPHWSRVVDYIPFLTYCSNALPLISSSVPETREHKVADAMIKADLKIQNFLKSIEETSNQKPESRNL